MDRNAELGIVLDAVALGSKITLACYTQEEIAEAVVVDQHTVRDVLGETAKSPESLKPSALHWLSGSFG
jgi:hypothetical protein